MNTDDYFHKSTQTYCCPKTMECFECDKLYISTDIVSPAALAHITPYITGKSVGCDAVKWTDMYPSTLMFARFVNKCRYMNTKIKIFRYTVSRPDLDEIMKQNEDIITIVGELHT